ncbi:hypothetical protein PXNS11_250310 [Stutzerimonas xanthomarina]|nr:hypothetical protein PXNS11_250310 [Stutzerimonas xanthomarina]
MTRPRGRFSRAASRQRSPARTCGPPYQDRRTFDGSPACLDSISSNSKRTTSPVLVGNPLTVPWIQYVRPSCETGRRSSMALWHCQHAQANPRRSNPDDAQRRRESSKPPSTPSTHKIQTEGNAGKKRGKTRPAASANIHVRMLFRLLESIPGPLWADGQFVAGVDLMSQNSCQRRIAIRGIIAGLQPAREPSCRVAFSNATCRTPIASRLTSPCVFSAR